jgi:arylsulfatase A-like enzyme
MRTIIRPTTILFVLLVCTIRSMAQLSPLSQAVVQNDHQQPFIPRPEQDRAAAQKLAALEKKTGRKPNILWIVIDDMGYGDPGCYGGGEAIGAATPSMDRLAAGGLRLTSTYSQPTCTPTRSAILTGRLPCRTGLIRPIIAGDKLKANPWADETSLAKLLSESGYSTVLSGKWHIGSVEGMRPFEVGFDEFYGFYAAQKEMSQHLDERRYPDLVLDTFKLHALHALGEGGDLMYGKKGGRESIAVPTKSLDDVAEADQRLRDYSIKKIREFAASKKPFFLEHSFMKVHTDNFASKKYKGKSASKYPYKDGVVEVDAIIGELVAELEKTGLLENTFIFITSDNGPQEDAWPDAGFTPFRGAKGSTWEGGVRVPGIVYWKGMIQPRVSDDLFDLMDLFNTALNLAGIGDKLPADRYIDGIDQTSFLLADNGRSKRDRIHYWHQTKPMAIRLLEYKAHFQTIEYNVDWLMIDQSTIQSNGGAPWMFNLYIDPKERRAVGHAMSAWQAVLPSEFKFHAATFKKFPMKNIGLSASMND